MAKIRGMWSTPLLPLLPDPLRHGVVAPDRVLFRGKIEETLYKQMTDVKLWLLYSHSKLCSSVSGLHVNAHKTEYMCYNQTGDITTLDGTPLKLVDKFTYLVSNVSSTEKDIETRLTKAWTAIDRLSIIWKSELTNKMKRSFFQAAVVSILLYGCTTWTLTKTTGEEARRQLHKNAASNIEQVLAATPHKAPTIRPPVLPSRKLSKLDKSDMQDTAGEAGMSS